MAFHEQLCLPSEGFVRLRQVLAVVPVSRSSWWDGIRKGKYPAPIKLGPRTTAWRVEDIRALIERAGIAMIDVPSQFRNAIRAAGLKPPEVIEPGRLHRFPGIGKRQSNRAGWCILFDDGLGGCFGDWSSSLSETWQTKRDKPFSPVERAAFLRRVEDARAHAKAERDTRQAEAAQRASVIWDAANLAPSDHPYLIRKGIKAYGAKLYRGALTLPVMDFTGKLTSLQFIDHHGRKRLLPGGRKQGCFIAVAGEMTEAPRVIICEGWATGCTLAKDEPAALVLAAVDAGNLEPVAMAARRRWPSAELIIAGDDDRLTADNPGATKARAAAIASNALLALPPWPEDAPESLSDFNDLAVWLERRAV